KYLGVAATEKIDAPKDASAAAAADSGERAAEPEREVIPEEEVPEGGDLVVIPDFTGLSVAQALELAQARGVKIAVEGAGRARKQFPPSGRALKSITCHVTFDPG